MNTTRKVTTGLVLAAGIFAGQLAHASTAHAVDPLACVDNHEFNHADPGASKTQIASLFGTRGVRVDASRGSEIYNMISAYAHVDLTRLPRQRREVRKYPVCLSPRVDDGYVLALYDTRRHALVVAEMITYGTAGKTVQ